MLSVLIPIYNVDVRALVKKVHEQLLAASTVFEIICIDDFSEENIKNLNSEIGQLQNVIYKLSNSNHGRVKTRQELANRATYNWLLFLDADVMPKRMNFIQNYLKYANLNYDAIYGGFAYENKKPIDDFTLRWTYGKVNEQVSAVKRNKKTYKITISANFMILRKHFLKINSKITSRGYGYDNYFGAQLKKNKINVLHIDNEVYHLGLESNTSYLNKVKQSIETLHSLDESRQLVNTDNSLLGTYRNLKKWRIHILFSWIFKTFKTKFESNLLNPKPKISILQLYKLSYICYLDLNS